MTQTQELVRIYKGNKSDTVEHDIPKADGIEHEVDQRPLTSEPEKFVDLNEHSPEIDTSECQRR